MKSVVRIALVLCGAGVAASSSLQAAQSSGNKSDQAHEYQEARKIALKDARVQAAFQRAEEKLNDRIIEIDPSLKPYVEKHSSPSPAKGEAVRATAVTTPKHPAVHKTTTATAGATHVIAKGETLSSIALQYKVSVASLKTANGITDERKLRVGQKLVIPASKNAAPPAKKEQGFWDKVKGSF